MSGWLFLFCEISDMPGRRGSAADLVSARWDSYRDTALAVLANPRIRLFPLRGL